MPSQIFPIYRFGVFELDCRSGELRKSGVKLKLQDHSYQVLLKLLDHPSEIVSREELRSALWLEDTFVDFEAGLNAAIKRLREALGDSADKPIFVETLPRRGYRFIAPVATVDGIAAGASPASAATARAWKLIVTAAGLLVAAALAGAFFWHSRQNQGLTDKDSIVLADFTNSTGEPIFDDTLKQALRVQLEQSPFLSVLSEREVDEELALMGRPSERTLTPDLAQDLCQRIGSKAVLASSIASMGSHYAIGLSAFNCYTGKGLASEQVEADSRERVLEALGTGAARIREKLGESLASVQKYDTPLERATTSSLEALKAYSLGLKIWWTKGADASLPFFQRAIELDKNFAMAHGRMAVAYSQIGRPELSVTRMRNAFDLRDRVSERERFYLESHFYDVVTGEWEKAALVYELWQQIYPRDPVPHDHLQDFYSFHGKQEEALVEALEHLHLQPNSVSAYEDSAFCYLSLDRLAEAQAVFQKAEQRNLQSSLLQELRYQLAFLKNDAEEMDRLAAAETHQLTAQELAVIQGLRRAQLGRIRTARDLWRRAVRSAESNGGIELAALYQDTAGLVEAYLGNTQQTRIDVDAGRKLSVNRLNESVSALALALAGDVRGAEKLDADLNRRWPRDSLVQRYWLPTIRAAVSLDRQDAETALELLNGMGSYEMSTAGQLDPVYLRGRAYLQQANGNAAAVEFWKITQHPGLVLQNPVGALAHLGLARSYIVQHNIPQASAAYQDFLTLWKDADPDIPILKQAQAEYAKLK